MKIGFSFGRCVRDIVNGVVSIDDVMLIIARTKMPDAEAISDVCDQYAYDSFHGINMDECKRVALVLFETGKIHQPRLYNSWRTSVSDDYIWMDLVPTVNDMTPAVQEAWTHYKMMLALSTDQIIPPGENAPTN